MSTPPSSRGPRDASGSTPVGGPAPRRRAAWLIPLLVGLVVVALVLLLLSQCSGDDSTEPGPDASSTSAPATSADASDSPSTSSAASPSAAPSSASSSAPAPPPADPSASVLTAADGTPLLPLDPSTPDGGLAARSGQQVQATAAAVESVPADEGFWLGSSPTDRVWAQLTGTGESPFVVKAGQLVTFTAQVEANAPDFAASSGVDAIEGAVQLGAQGQHLVVDRASLQLVG